jgi:hypothetical protein
MSSAYPCQGVARDSRQQPYYQDEQSRALVASVLGRYTLEEPKAYFDHHGVLDVLTESEALRLGIELDHFSLCFGMLSFGRAHSLAALENPNVRPFLAQSDFQFFTDVRQSCQDDVLVYRPQGWPLTALRFKGDKAQVMTLVGGQAILFDDGKDNVQRAMARGHAAVLVRSGWSRRDRGHYVVPSALNWQEPVISWYKAHTPNASEERLRMYSDCKSVWNWEGWDSGGDAKGGRMDGGWDDSLWNGGGDEKGGCKASFSKEWPSMDKAAVSTTAAADGIRWSSGGGEKGGDQKGGWEGSGWNGSRWYGGGDEKGGGESVDQPIAPWKDGGSDGSRWNGCGDEKGGDEKGGWNSRSNGGGEEKGVDKKGCWNNDGWATC